MAKIKRKTDSLCDKIMNDRDIKNNTCKTYISSLRILRKKLNPKLSGILTNTDFLNDFDGVMKVIHQEKKITTKKNRLTAILVALGCDVTKNKILINKYNSELKRLGEMYMTFLKTQKKTDTQKKNWISYPSLIKIVNGLALDVKKLKLRTRKEDLTNKEFRTLQEYVILRTYLTFPLRNDFADMKILTVKEYKTLTEDIRDNNNYLVIDGKSKMFYINQFKNKKFLGDKVLKIPAPLNKILNMWLKYNTSDYFIVKADRNRPLSPHNITKFLNTLFMKKVGKKISTSMIRHIIISHKLIGEKTISQRNAEERKIVDMFFHSKIVNDLYRKID